MKYAVAIVLLLASVLFAEPQPPVANEPHPVPPDLVIEELRDVYSQLFAEEVVVRYRAPQAPERSEVYTIRVDPGPDPEKRPARLFLELGPLHILFADNEMIAVNQRDSHKYVRQRFDGPITPSLVERLLPPIPLPHLSLAAPSNDMLRAPTPYTSDIHWTSGTLDAESRPGILQLQGTGSESRAVLVANADEIRLMSIAVRFAAPLAGGEAQMQLLMRAVDPGDPDLWTINTEGRQRVATISQLRPRAQPGPIPAGDRVPDLGFTRRDNTRWSLYSALRAASAIAPPGEAPRPIALILIRMPADLDEADRRLRVASEAAGKLRGPDAPQTSQIAVAGITSLSDYSRERWEAARATWENLNAASRDELLWGHSPTQSIDLFAPDAAAILVIVNGDRTLEKVVPLTEKPGEDESVLTPQDDDGG